MDSISQILLLALLPGIGYFLGGAIAIMAKPPSWFVGVALHAAAGIAIAVISLELMPRAIEQGNPLYLIAAFAGGAVTSIIVAESVGRWREHTGAVMVVVATAVDLATDGLMTGAGSSIAATLGLFLAASQVIGNIPTGFAATANLGKSAGAGSRWAMLLCLPLLPLAAAALGFAALRHAGDHVQASALAFMAGLLLLTTIEDTVEQGDQPSPPRRYSSLAFAAGFTSMIGATELAGQ